MIYVLHSGLFVTTFLVMLNGFLHGAKKRQIDAALSVILLALLLAVFVSFGWKAGLLAVGVVFIYGAITRPIAGRVAAHLMAAVGGVPSAAYVGVPPRALERISRELAREVRSEDMLRELTETPNRSEKAEDALLDYCMAQPKIQSVMQEFGADREMLRELYSTLCLAGAGQWAGGHWVAASALAYPDSLRYLLTNVQLKPSYIEPAYALITHFERGAPLG